MGEGRLLAALIVTAGFMLVEVVAGALSGSLALIADAGHMLTDAAALALAFYAARVSRRAADARRSYGYGRVLVLASFVNAISLMLIVVWIAVEALRRLFSPVEVLAMPMLIVAVLGLLANLVAFAILHLGVEGNLNLRGAVAHVLSDLLGSAAAIVASLVILYGGWTAADPLLSLLVAALILRLAIRLARESGHVLLEGTPGGFDADDLALALTAAVPQVLGVHHVHAWTLIPGRPVLTMHAQVGADIDADTALARIHEFLTRRYPNVHATVQIERIGCASPLHEHVHP
jgi:cobalt-zinc-cadmium efflux system protein